LKDEMDQEEPAPGAIPSEPANDDAATASATADPRDAEIADLKDKLLRALAETENVRRRGAKDREDMAKFAVSGFARDMVKIAEDLHRAVDSANAGASDALIEGVRLTEKELLTTLERHGIKRVDPKSGEKFNHDLHEAMFEVPTDAQEPGTIVQVMEAGYTIHDRLLRPARVGVAKSAGGQARIDTQA
jgi:molecular chaperone GrpE